MAWLSSARSAPCCWCFGLAQGEGGWTQSRLLLTGVIVAAGCGAVVTLMLAVAPDERLRGMLFWLMGDLSQTGDPQLVLILLVVVLLIALPFARELNLLARGADFALRRSASPFVPCAVASTWSLRWPPPGRSPTLAQSASSA
jgi:ABC-type Fe3+-siderophore transport system permease subunit